MRSGKWVALAPAVLAATLIADLLAADRDRSKVAQSSANAKVAEDRKTCGQNALYVLLRLNGEDVHRDDVMKVLPASASGTSLEELQSCAASFGVKLDAIKASGDDIERLPLPAIVHTGPDSTRGHYLVLVALYDPGYPRFIDGTSGETIDWNRAEFLRYWTGHALVLQRGAWSRIITVLPLIVFAGGLAAAGATIWGMWKNRVRSATLRK